MKIEVKFESLDDQAGFWMALEDLVDARRVDAVDADEADAELAQLLERFMDKSAGETHHCEICGARPGEVCTDSSGGHDRHITRDR